MKDSIVFTVTDLYDNIGPRATLCDDETGAEIDIDCDDYKEEFKIGDNVEFEVYYESTYTIGKLIGVET